jgi:hypothetical protein
MERVLKAATNEARNATKNQTRQRPNDMSAGYRPIIFWASQLISMPSDLNCFDAETGSSISGVAHPLQASAGSSFSRPQYEHFFMRVKPPNEKS